MIYWKLCEMLKIVILLIGYLLIFPTGVIIADCYLSCIFDTYVV